MFFQNIMKKGWRSIDWIQNRQFSIHKFHHSLRLTKIPGKHLSLNLRSLDQFDLRSKFKCVPGFFYVWQLPHNLINMEPACTSNVYMRASSSDELHLLFWQMFMRPVFGAKKKGNPVASAWILQRSAVNRRAVRSPVNTVDARRRNPDEGNNCHLLWEMWILCVPPSVFWGQKIREIRWPARGSSNDPTRPEGPSVSQWSQPTPAGGILTKATKSMD